MTSQEEEKVESAIVYSSVGKDTEVNNYRWSREFIMGSKARNSPKITPNSDIYTKVLCSRPPTNIKINISQGRYVRQIIISDIIIGFRSAIVAKDSKIHEINNNDKAIVFKTVEIQFHNEQAPSARSLHWLGINYMRLIDQDNKETVVGTYHAEKKGETLQSGKKVDILYDDLQTETGQLLLTGIYVCKCQILSFQFVDIIGEINTNSLLSIYRMPPNQGLHGIVNDSRQILYNHMIGIEDDFPLTVLSEFIDFAISWGSDPVVSRQADFIQIIEKSMDGDLGMMHSVMALQRYIDHSIQTKSIQNLKNNMKFLIKVRQYWYAIYNAVLIAKRIYYYTPSLDIYSVTYLDPTKWNYFLMIFTFITQLGMMILIISSIEYDNIGGTLEKNGLSIVVSIIICVMVIVFVKRQIDGVLQFYVTFPTSKKSFPMILSAIANIVIAIIIIPLNFLIISVTEDRFDLVLNALAILFILEIDDQMVDLSPIDEKAIYLSTIYQRLMSDINSVDKNYISNMKTATVNTEECKLTW